MTYTTNQKTALIDRSKEMTITLDGEPAVINGRLLEFAVVSTLSGSKRFEWAWATVEKILKEGGSFKS